MLTRFKNAQQEYPRQFWLMFWGMMISTIGASMIWPFLMIYVSQSLDLPLTAVASLITLSSIAGLIATISGGPVVDKLGRKWVMVLGLALNGLGYILLSQANSYWMFAVVMAMNGAVNPLYRIGADAMMADLIPQDKRVEAYSLLRMSNNVGVALGPAIGGFIAGASYATAFFIAAAGLCTYALLLVFFARETLPQAVQETREKKEIFGGYNIVFGDKPFVGFVLASTLTQVCAALIWVMMGMYAKTNFGIPEKLYGFIPTTNAIMVVVLQFIITQFTRRHRPLWMLALGAAFYAAAVSGVALAGGFWGFWGVMVVMTIGELILVPTASTYVANMAPPDMRGRYMGIFGLTWGAASGFGALMGGYLSDSFGIRAPWIGGGIMGALSVLAFCLLALWQMRRSRYTPEVG